MGRDIIQYIDIHDTSNGHIDIDDRMRPIHDYPRGRGAGSQNVEISYNHYPPEVNCSGGRDQKCTFLFIGIMEKI